MVDVTQPLEHYGNVTQDVIQPAVTGSDVLRQLQAQIAAKGNPLGEAAKAIGAISGAIQGIAGGIDGAGSELARDQGVQAGMASVTRDANGVLQIQPHASTLFGGGLSSLGGNKSTGAYERAATEGALAAGQTGINTDIQKAVNDNTGDPEAFNKWGQGYMSDLASRAKNSGIGGQLALHALERIGQAYNGMTAQKAAQDTIDSRYAIDSKITSDTNDAYNLALKGGMTAPEGSPANVAYLKAHTAAVAGIQSLGDNKSLGVTPAEVADKQHALMVNMLDADNQGKIDATYKSPDGGAVVAAKQSDDRVNSIEHISEADRLVLDAHGKARIAFNSGQFADRVATNKAAFQALQSGVANGTITPDKAPPLIDAIVKEAGQTGNPETGADAVNWLRLHHFSPAVTGLSPSQTEGALGIPAAGQAGGRGPADINRAIIGQESGGNPNAPTSSAGAVGIGQLKPGTFEQYAKPGESITNPADNAAVSRRITDDYYQKYNGDLQRVAVAYASGPGNVAPSGSATPWKENVNIAGGKNVSAYVAEVTGRLGGGAPTATPVFRANNAHISPEWGNPDSPGFKSQYLMPIAIPGTGKTLDVHKNSATAFEGFLGDLKAAGYPLDDVQSFNNRDIRGGSTKSQHAWGNAIDINPEKQPLGSQGSDFAKYGIDAHALASKWGLIWGGDFIRRKDPMHFENARPAGAPLNAAPGTVAVSGQTFTQKDFDKSPYLLSNVVQKMAEDGKTNSDVANALGTSIKRVLNDGQLPNQDAVMNYMQASSSGPRSAARDAEREEIATKYMGLSAQQGIGGSGAGATGGAGAAIPGGTQAVEALQRQAESVGSIQAQNMAVSLGEIVKKSREQLRNDSTGYAASTLKIPPPPPINYADPQAVAQGLAYRGATASRIAATEPGFSPSAVPKQDMGALTAAAASGDPKQQMGVVLGLGSIPQGPVRDATFANSDVRGALLAAAHSGNPAVMAQAYSLLDRQYRSNPMTFDETYGKGTLAELRGWQDKTSREPPAKVAAEIMKPLDSGTIAAREATDRGADANLKLITNDSIVTQLAHGGFFSRASSYAPASDAPAELLGRMRADYEDAYKQSFAKFADDSAAQKYAVEATTGIRDGVDTGGGKWGLSPANGGRLMPYPPERSPANPPINGSHDWIKDQADKVVASAYSSMRSSEQITPPGVSVLEAAMGRTAPPYALVPDPQTESEMTSGQPPSYRIAVQDNNGRLSMLPGVSFRPDYRAALAAQQQAPRPSRPGLSYADYLTVH